ncbi:DCC1-like thiol-disulfide oxidoreductase family protein [Psychrobacter sp. HD31]|uniref:thiol-disulfide oxidoreductase DCC family protein n=1 Tax=Psychrobacter sp. HD31 TaxID=3112003 RepID=UPI003DA504F4
MDNKPQSSSKDILYYDSDCPICSAEMDKLCRLKQDSLELIPINQITKETAGDIDESEINNLYDELHIRTSDGKWLKGYEANIYAWQQTKYAPFAKWLGKPPLSWFGKLSYRIWLKWYRWQRNKR